MKYNSTCPIIWGLSSVLVALVFIWMFPGIWTPEADKPAVVWPSDNNVTRSECRRCVEKGAVFLMRPSHRTPTRMTFRCRAYVERGSIIQAFPYYGSYSCDFMGCDDLHVWVWYTFGNFSCLDGKNNVILS